MTRAGERISTIQTVQERPVEHDAAASAAADPAATGEPQAMRASQHSADEPVATPADAPRRERSLRMGLTAAVTIIAALIASMTLAAVTAFNTLRSDITSVRTELQAELTKEIGSLRTEMHEFRSEVGAVLRDHAERLARIETLILDGALSSSPQP